MRYLKQSMWFRRHFALENVDLVHCSDVLAAFYAALGGRLARKPVLCQVRNRYRDFSLRDQSFLRLVQHFAFVSEDTRSRFGYRVPAPRATVTYDGIPIPMAGSERAQVCEEFGIALDAHLVGMVARVAPQKDYFTLVKAARKVIRQNRHVRFLIVGDNSSTPSYRRHYAEVCEAIKANDLLPYFVFTGARPDVQRLMAALDIFVLSTHMEGLPLVILEAMAHGKPVIATKVDGVPEVVAHARTGLLHEHEDAQQLASDLLALIGDPERRAALGHAGRALVQKEFSEEAFAQTFVNLYRNMLGGAETSLTQNRRPGGGSEKVNGETGQSFGTTTPRETAGVVLNATEVLR